MSVDNLHSDYSRMADIWSRCQDVASGQDAVHNAGVKYLPKLKDQADPDYKAYRLRATFYNATWRTISGLVGMLFRKPPKVEIQGSIKNLLNDVTMSGIPLQVFVQQISEECIKVGRCGVFVDYPSSQMQDGATVAQVEALGLRPSMQLYKADRIINWRVTRVNNQSVLSLVVLKEDAIELKDEFTEKSETHYRVLDLVEGKYRVRLFKKGSRKEDIQIGPDVFPIMNGNSMDFIPFVFFGSDDLTPDVDEPPLIDLVNLNLAHYRTTADYEHGCHFTGLPTPVVSGYSPPEGSGKLYIGSQSAWVFTDPAAKASYLEFTGQGLQALEKNLDRKEAQMAVLGARMLEEQKRAVESAEAASIHRKGEESVLSSIAQVISMGTAKCLSWFSLWARGDGVVEFELNRDFFPAPMTPQMLQQLIAGWQSGAYSYETLFDNLQVGEIISPDTTAEEEQTKIDNSPLMLNSAAFSPSPDVTAAASASA